MPEGVPDDAPLSEDGKFWWDGSDWQPMPGASGETGAHGAGGTEGDGGGGAVAGADSTTWPPAGYPADANEWTAEQKEYWFGGAYDASDDYDVEEPSEIVVASIDDGEGSGGGDTEVV